MGLKTWNVTLLLAFECVGLTLVARFHCNVFDFNKGMQMQKMHHAQRFFH